ncbi:Rho GTPase regulating protein, putative [Ixodes scapularis]|uniref:Rho GTPase regulating protein, putative n=1 Tax=Ixodes scapularis TaxID=6945 RepID=B7PUH2_IXOSC|nr:Rho GTPase regulating protein, putative [Ixodes scapularis]|eukprot:XP_002406064.1 Rho GTPase regulating protein, putative [Ixodes scapularis]
MPLERLLQYEQYLSQLASATPKHHPDYNDLSKAAQKAKSMVRRGDSSKEETDLDRIQDLFPSDNLRLHDRDPLSPRKGLLRTKSAAASKLHRALSGKSKSVSDMVSPSKDGGVMVVDGGRLGGNWVRYFIMDGPAQFSIGLQNQERHLFLLSDVLLIAKPKSSGSYKLKEKVRTCEMWLSNCLADVSESTRSVDTSFVIGWPTTNVVVTFRGRGSSYDLCAPLFSHLLETIEVNNTHSTKDCIFLCTQKLDGSFNSEEFQLWVKSGKEESPYPLIGHEYPYCIKMNFMREFMQSSNLDLSCLSDVINATKCVFILRRNYHKVTLNEAEKPKKARRPTIINWPFKKAPSKQSSTDSGGSVSPVVGNLFGQELSKISPSGTLPKPVMEFLGCLPDCLLQRGLYSEWLNVLRVEPEWKKRDFTISLLKRLPPANVELLRHILCVLWHISHRSNENKMPPSNLAVCIGPSLLSAKLVDGYHSITLQSEISEQVPQLVEYLIEHSMDIFGKDFLELFGEAPQKDPSLQDSGAEESDSPHSLQESGSAFRRDDSSIDSLERALMEDSSPKLPNRTKVSLTNLSRDSGLTLSDTQLYTPEDEVEMDNASSALQGMTKSVPHLEAVGVQECIHSRSNGITKLKSVTGQSGQTTVPKLHAGISPSVTHQQAHGASQLPRSHDPSYPFSKVAGSARQLYEESLKIYNEKLDEGSETHHAILVKVDSSDEGISESPPPPLPPKPHQSVHRTVSDGTGIRLRHHPPVHVKDSQLVNRGKCVVVSSFHDRCQNQALYDFPKEISWSVAQLRSLFSKQSTAKDGVNSQPDSLCSGHSRTESVGNTCTGGEESYV